MSEASTVDEELAKYPAAASEKDVLALKPNDVESATSGPDAQSDPTMYVTWTKPDGSSFIAPLSNSETYERKGYKEGSAAQIPDIVAWNAENAAKEPEAPKEKAEPHHRGEHAEKAKD
jgi:hypothetical protein